MLALVNLMILVIKSVVVYFLSRVVNMARINMLGMCGELG
jgi:hypothetical protein